jgi:hypothetical protein
MPGFNHHGDERGGTVTEDCGGAGGNTCFAINTAIDPTPPEPDVFNLFDLVAHEFGHCLTIGHVGDGAEGPWSTVPTNDIMSYDLDPPDRNKCVSTLDVEGIAVSQSRYLDTNDDGLVNARDRLDANQATWDRTGDHFQVQHPIDHYYASSTGNPLDCPQPDLALRPGNRTDWTPEPRSTSTNELTLSAPSGGARSKDGTFRVRGTVAHVRHNSWPTVPSAATASGTGPYSQRYIVDFDHAGGNHFDPSDTSLGLFDDAHRFSFDVAQPSDVAFRLAYTSPSGVSDLDLIVENGSYDSGAEGSTQANPEEVHARALKGKVELTVDPYLIADGSVDYTLRAVVTPKTVVRDDTEGPADEHVRVYIDNKTVWAAHQDVTTARRPANFDIGVSVGRGAHTLRVEWERLGKVVATKSVRVSAG